MDELMDGEMLTPGERITALETYVYVLTNAVVCLSGLVSRTFPEDNVEVRSIAQAASDAMVQSVLAPLDLQYAAVD